MVGVNLTVNGPRHHYRQTYNTIRKSRIFRNDGIQAKERVITIPFKEGINPQVMYTILLEVVRSMEIDYEIEKIGFEYDEEE